METGTISQSKWFKASPQAFYALLTDREKYESFVADQVFYEPNANSSFSIFDGYCTGINLKYIKERLSRFLTIRNLRK